MTPPVDRSLLDDAVALARSAGDMALSHFRRPGLVVDRKGDGTPVTEADRSAERLLRKALAERYPDDAVVGEEEADTAGTSGRRWIIDPVDGTKAFTRGVPTWTTLLAVEDEHGPAVGVIVLPALGEVVYAGRGLGAWFDDGPPAGRQRRREAQESPARVSARTDLAGAYLCTSAVGHWDRAVLNRVLDAGIEVRTWGDGWGYALVATGRVEAMVDPVAAVWDLAPMPVILAEAGGRFADLNGRPGPAGGSGLATNGHLHDELLGLLRA